MTSSSARTLKGPRRFVRRVAHRAISPKWQFLRGFIKNPVMVGSVIPSSKVLIDKMLGPVKWDEVKLFVEYGPGVGTFTRPILDKLPADAKLIAIDTNEDFIKFLGKEIDDPRLILAHGSAADVEQIVRDHGFPHADYVLSGLPFSTLPQRRSVSGVSVQPQGARLHRPAFRADRARVRVDQRPARDLVLGVARTGVGLALIRRRSSIGG